MSDNSKLFLTPEQAASVLGVSVDDLRIYEEAGYLRVITQQEKRFYNRSDIVHLMEMKDSDRLPTLSQETLLHLHAELNTLRSQVSTILNLLGIGEGPLTLEPTQLALLYEQIIDMLAQDEYTRNDLEAWSTVFLRLRVGHVAALTTCTQNDRPWEVVYRLAHKMCMFLADDDAVTVNVHLRSLLIQLDAARTHVQNLWAAAVQLDPARDYRTRLMRTVPSLDDILNHVSRARGTSIMPPVLETVLTQSGLKPPKYPKK